MMVKSAQAVTTDFPTSLPTTGAASNADSLPTGTLYVDGTANGATVTVTNITTGLYKAAVTLPSLTAGQVVSIVISATIGGVACVGKVWEAVADTSRVSDVATTIGAAGAGLTAVGDTAGTTTLLSRLSSARAGYLDNLSAGAVALQSTLTTLATSVAALPAAVWDRLTTALTTSGSIGAWILANAGSGASPATFWAYASRTLTMGASSIISAVTGDRLTAYVGAYTSITLTGLTDFTGYKRIYFTVKSNPREDADSDSILQIRKSNPANGTDDGLLYIAGAAGTKAHGSITVNSTTSITIIVLNAAAALWESGQFSYDVWYIGSDDQPRPASEGGSFDIVDAVSRAAS